MSLERESTRIVIAGASSLLGAELKSLLEQGRFAASDFRLLDEELAAGTLTEAGGEPVVIQPVENDSFNRARFVFFAGSAAFTAANLDLAKRSGALVIDLSGHSAIGGGSHALVSRIRFAARATLRGRHAIETGFDSFGGGRGDRAHGVRAGRSSAARADGDGVAAGFGVGQIRDRRAGAADEPVAVV